MTTTVMIDGRAIAFRATAAVPRLYRLKFRRDIMRDMQEIDKAVKKSEDGEEAIPPHLLEVFENMAFIMAKHADPTVRENTVEDWLDGFETFSIYEVFPQIFELWQLNTETLSSAKKNKTQ